MKGKLYVIGVGPGDPDLLTLKAFRILNEVPCLCVPKGREEGSSLALSIVKGVADLESKEIIEAYFPMRKTGKQEVTKEIDAELKAKWQGTVQTISDRLNRGIDLAFITIGDPALYSTFFYLYQGLMELKHEVDLEIIPGVSSIHAAAAKAKLPLVLGDERVAIIPAAYPADLENLLKNFDTLVLMKVCKSFNQIVKTLERLHLVDQAVYMVRLGHENERVFSDIRSVNESDLDYFSLMIIKRGR